MVRLTIKRRGLHLMLVPISIIIFVGIFLFFPLWPGLDYFSYSYETHILPFRYEDELVVGGLENPIGLAFLPDGRILYIELEGQIGVVEDDESHVFYTLPDVNNDGPERGLLGIAVDPDFPDRPYIYLHYTAKGPPTRVNIARFTLETTPNLTIDPATKKIWFDAPDDFTVHNGGTLRFDKEKMLIASFGDDGISCNSQDLRHPNGKLVRMKVGDGADPSDLSTLVPDDNPFADASDPINRLVFIYGLRNPFRFDIDHVTGDVLIGDPGDNLFEEVDFAHGGENMGWPYFEGSYERQKTLCPGQGSKPEIVEPIYEYPNIPLESAIIGSMIYRGNGNFFDSNFPSELDGAFFFVHFFRGNLQVLQKSETGWELVPGIDAENFGKGFHFVSDMRVGPDGAVYYPQLDEIRRIYYVSSFDIAVRFGILAVMFAATAVLGLYLYRRA